MVDLSLLEEIEYVASFVVQGVSSWFLKPAAANKGPSSMISSTGGSSQLSSQSDCNDNGLEPPVEDIIEERSCSTGELRHRRQRTTST
jgi:hypothetical protein